MNGKRKMLSTLRNTIVSSLEPTSNKKENQMTNENDNRIELISLNEFIQVDENDIELGDEDDIELGDEDERPFPDSDEAIRALQDVAEAVDEMEIEIARLRAELKTALAERDAARVEVCEMTPRYEGRHVAVERGWDCYKKETK